MQHPTHSSVRGLFRFLHTENPFYLISACLILIGIQLAFQRGAVVLQDSLTLAAALAAHVVVMAAAAVFVVRGGGLWQDARSILLVLLIQFIAISCSFDELCYAHPHIATGLLMGGFVFSIAVSELVLRLIRLRFPWRYRVPIWLFLAAYFAAPLASSPSTTGLTFPQLESRMGWFPLVASALVLSWIPAACAGAPLSRDNGSPWSWPWIPWTVFVVLGGFAPARIYALSVSFADHAHFTTPFDSYWLVPLGFSLLLLMLEVSLKTKNAELRSWLLWCAPGLLLLASPGNWSPVQQRFLSQFTGFWGSPFWLTAIGLLAFYAWSRLRGVKGAEWGVALAMLSLSIVGDSTHGIGSLTAPQWWPWLFVASALLGRGVAVGSSSQCVVGGWALSAALCFAAGERRPELATAVFLHLLPATCLLVGCCFHDRAAAAWRVAGGLVVAALAVVGAQQFFVGEVDWRWAAPHQAVLLVTAATMLVVYRGMWRLRLLGLHTTTLLAVLHLGVWERPAGSGGAGATTLILAGCWVFVLAVAISATKTNLWKRTLAYLAPAAST